MTRLWNEPADFADEMITGFVHANARWVRKVYGGVSRSTVSRHPEVALVIGGGSGHYPAFAGLVGPGLAHGAAMGNLFASPSAHQVESVARASHRGRGVLLSYGNYAGDVLHFTEAQEALRAEGIDCRSVAVTDDIFSAGPHERQKRRGIAGDLTVFKIAGAAAALGYDLDGVQRVAQRANLRTRSMGVAFGGCTMPGAAEPLFSVPDGRMAVGLGIHGEPGLAETGIPTANGLAELFIERLLDDAEVPEDALGAGARVVPILNGLGSVKAEELFVVYARVAELAEARGLTLVDPQVGEFCTSFDMAGVSLTLLWLDDELERLWRAPAEAPAFRTGSFDTGGLQAAITDDDAWPAERSVPAATAESREAAAHIAELLGAVRDVIDDHAAELGRIDAIAGDGDHGIGMQRGSRAASSAAADLVQRGAGAGTLLAGAADAWADRAGGTSGALWGVILRTLGSRLGDGERVTRGLVGEGLAAACEAVMDFGKARVGDKTLVDALAPFTATLSDRLSGGSALASAWEAAAKAAVKAAEDTADLMPVKGRARSHGDKARGVPDPGAVSLALIATTIGAQLASQ